MGFPSADHLLKQLTRPQFVEWMVWATIRGPIGAPRRDYYTSFIAMHAGKPYAEEVTLDDFKMPWAVSADADDDEDER